MLSTGNGRHRRPRQAPAAMVTVAATGAGIALPLLGAGAAHAADNATWDKVASCETGGLWSANTGNGFYGGLAITQDTWKQYGGSAYAERPDLASRQQQIAVAEKILSDLGPDAWPGCEAGLFADAYAPSVDPGNPGDTATPTLPSVPSGLLPSVTPASPHVTDPAAPTGGGKSTGPVTVTPGASGVPGVPSATGIPTLPGVPGVPGGGTPTAPGAPSAAPSAPGQATPAPGETTTPSTGRHGKPYSPTDEQLAAADRATRTEAFGATDASTGDFTGDTGGTSGHGHYTVGSGDSLSGIADAQHVEGGWRHLYDTNHQVIGDDPNLIKPGQILDLG